VFATALSKFFPRIVLAVELEKRSADASVDWSRIPRGISTDLPVVIRVLAGKTARHFIDEQERVQIDLAWMFFTPYALETCHEASMDVCDGSSLEPGWDVIEQTELKDHKVYRHLLAFLQRVIHLKPEQFMSKFGRPPAMSYQSAFALPGSGLGYSMLSRYFLPPLAFLQDTLWPVWQYYAEKEPAKLDEPKLIAIAGQSIAQESFEIRELERRFEKALTLTRLSAPGDQAATGA
jgi:hypothetical protein